MSSHPQQPAPAAPPAARLIIYDLDGTLVDAFEDIAAGVNHALAAHGLPTLTIAQVRRHVGEGAAMLIRGCLGEVGGGHLFEQVYPAYRAYYAAHPVDCARPYPGVPETLTRLRALGLKQAVLTNKPDEVSRQICDKLGLTALLDGVWGERPDRARKPEAEALLAVARHFGVGAGECVMVGDGPADLRVARAAGARVIGATWGILSVEQLASYQPEAMIDQFPQLLALLAASAAIS